MIRRIGLALAFTIGLAGVSHAATVTLNITAGANAASHTIMKSTNGGAYSALATLPMPTVQYIDNAVIVGNTYSYTSTTNSSLDSAAPSAPCTVALLSAGPSTIQCVINP